MTREALHRYPAGANDQHEEERRQLAAAFRWTVRLNMHEGIANHYSLAVSDDGSRFLINPNGRHFSRVRASDLLLLDANDPTTMDRPDAPDPTAWAIHGAMHRSLPQARCVLHVHPKYATVLGCLKDSGMPPIDQNTMRFYNRIAVDENFGGLGLGEEAERLPGCLGGKSVLVMGNHGVMVVGRSVAEAFDLLFYFERAAETLVTAYMTQRPLRIAPPEVAEKTARQWEQDYESFAALHLAEIQAILDREEPDYRG
jgi:ribulose-5-phosphate 4-epimerase/fuculose-1-phosphate aldolase